MLKDGRSGNADSMLACCRYILRLEVCACPNHALRNSPARNKMAEWKRRFVVQLAHSPQVPSLLQRQVIDFIAAQPNQSCLIGVLEEKFGWRAARRIVFRLNELGCVELSAEIEDELRTAK